MPEERKKNLHRGASEVVEEESKAHLEELERMEELEHRFHLCEKALQEESKGALELIGGALFEILRSIPLLSIFAMTPTLVGARMLWSEAMAELPSVYYSLGAYFQECSWFNAYTLAVASLCTSGVAVLAAFPATGATREYIFGHKAHGSCMWCLQTMFGACFFNIIGVCLSIVFLLLFLLLEGKMLPSFAVVWIMEGACKAGDASKDGVAEALAYYMQQTTTTDMEKRLDTFCSNLGEQTRNFDYRLHYFILGVAFLFIGIVWQLSMHISNYEKVTMSEDLDEVAERAAIQAYYAHHGYHYGAA